METFLRVLSEDEKTQVHERSLKILAETGVKVNTAKGRQYLKDAGVEVDENSKSDEVEKELDKIQKRANQSSDQKGF